MNFFFFTRLFPQHSALLSPCSPLFLLLYFFSLSVYLSSLFSFHFIYRFLSFLSFLLSHPSLAFLFSDFFIVAVPRVLRLFLLPSLRSALSCDLFRRYLEERSVCRLWATLAHMCPRQRFHSHAADNCTTHTGKSHRLPLSLSRSLWHFLWLSTYSILLSVCVCTSHSMLLRFSLPVVLPGSPLCSSLFFSLRRSSFLCLVSIPALVFLCSILPFFLSLSHFVTSSAAGAL